MKHLGDITKINGAEIEPVVYKVYRYTFPDGKIYIGVTSRTPQYRKDCGYQHNSKLTSAIRAVGWRSVSVDVLYETGNKDDAYEKEIELIRRFNSTDPAIGYNVSNGGRSTFLGLHHTEEQKQKIRNANTGVAFTPAHIQHLCEAHKHERKPVEMLSLNHVHVAMFDSLCAAAKHISCHKSCISRACKKGKPYRGFLWKFIEGGDLG